MSISINGGTDVCARRPGLCARELLRWMAWAREGDRREGILLRQGRAPFHLSAAGHEGIAALAYCLQPGDYVFPHYRDRAFLLALGVSNKSLALAYFARDNSSSGGRQMVGHFSDSAHHVVSLPSPTGLQVIPAAGAAWACQRDGNGAVSVCFIGDASTRQGEFYEGLCLALEHNLPLLLVVEDNQYGISTCTRHMNPWTIGALGDDRVVCVDGRDTYAVYEAGLAAASRARSGGGPTVLRVDLDRIDSHTSSDDQRQYRPREEIELMQGRDPITLLSGRLIREGDLTEPAWQAELKAIERQVDRDYQEAFAAPAPDPARATEHVFAAGPLPRRSSCLPHQETWTMVQAVNQALGRALETDAKVLLFGEDIEDPKGGVFGLTKGLSSRFSGRVQNSPLAEATIVGAAVGLALAGYRPVFELQFIDFVGPAFAQIVSQLSTVRWRSAGHWTCPVVLIAPCGAFLPCGGPWHSQTNEAWFAHAPGIQIAMPSQPLDAAAMLQAALAGEDPVLLLLPKHLFRQPMPAAPDEPLAFGEAAVRRSGTDVTVLAWGNCVDLALEAALQCHAEGTSAEVIDIRSIVPWDRNAVQQSIAKTGRLVVVQEDSRTCSFGQAIIAEVTSRVETWNLLSAPPQLVCRPDVHVGFSACLEDAVLPNVERIGDAISLVMRY